MSTAPPPTGAERLAARRSEAGPSLNKLLAVLVVGLAGAFLEGHSIAQVAKAPLWIIGVIGGIWLVFPALLAFAAWTLKARVAGASVPAVGVAAYLTGVLAVGGVTLTVQAERGSSFVMAGRITLVAAVACAMLAGMAYGRRVLRARARATLRRAGHHVSGTVTDDGLAVFRPGPNLKIATVTVRFIDLQGTERWLQCSAMQAPGRPLRVGDAVSVWFDPSTPGDLSRIAAEADNGASRIVRVHRRAGTRRPGPGSR